MATSTNESNVSLRRSSTDLDNSNREKRNCWVCFGSDQDDENCDAVWVCPCQCRGTLKWVHEECLQRWINEKQNRSNCMRVSCSHCKAHYILSFPQVNAIVRFIEQYDKLLYGSSPFVAVSLCVGSLYLCCASYGFITITQVMGYDEGRQLIDESDPISLALTLPIIPISLILAKQIKWEDFILRQWKQNANKIPRPFSYLIEAPPANPLTNCDQLLVDPGFYEPLGCTRMICGALLLPTVSSLVGKVFFSKLFTSQWRRSLFGGLVFLLIKGSLKIYLRKSQYIKYSQRTILNYDETTSSGAPEYLQNIQTNSGSPGYGQIPRDAQDGDDIDDEPPTARTRMLSIFIRLIVF